MAGILLRVTAILAGTVAASAAAASVAHMTVTVDGLDPGGRLADSTAFCAPPGTPVATHNISPAVAWSAGPAGTKSYALIMSDLDVPADLSTINKPGVTIAADAPRVTFIHWVLIDIPPSLRRLERGIESDGFVPGPRPVGPTDHGRRGANVYSGYFPPGPLAGPRGGFDGPCPPKNDPMPHRYVTRVYALDVATLGLEGAFTGEAALDRMKGHILAWGEAKAVYGLQGS